MSRLLNIDLDLFQTDRALNRPRTMADRLDGNPRYPDLAPWHQSQVRGFLERCGLDAKRPIRGRFVRHHDEVFAIWRNMVNTGAIVAPFDLVHADAHADLGCGDASHVYILRDLVHRPVDERQFPKLRYAQAEPPPCEMGDLEGLSEGNYLLFAIACRWLKSLVYVHHPTCYNDVPSFFFWHVPVQGSIKLARYASEQLQTFCNGYGIAPWDKGIEPLAGWEPSVEFRRVSCEDYSDNKPFDFAFLSLSPAYTHSATDGLIPVLREYISEVAAL